MFPFLQICYDDTVSSTIIPKPWGQEIILTTPDLPYAAKILVVNQGCRLSLQSHSQKTETITLISGQAQITLGTNPAELTTTNMDIDNGYTIYPQVIHRLTAVTDCRFFEASTPEKGTTFRLEDDYHRPDETK